nr:hypothetical protein [Tanacetum cinerariifolium]
GENLEKKVVVWQKPPSYTKEEPMQIVTTTNKPEHVKTEKAEEEHAIASREIQVSTLILKTRPNPKFGLIEFSSRPPLTETTLKFLISKPKTKIIRLSYGPMIDITPPEQPESPPMAPKADRGKGIATDDIESPIKLVKASTVVQHLDKEEKIKKTDEEAKLLFMSKPKLIKVVHEEASNVRIDHKVLTSAKGGQEFKKIQDAELKVLNREHSQKVTKAIELRKKRLDQYMWTTTNRLKPKPITDAKIYANTKPVIIIVYKGIDRLNFKVHNPFKFGDFRITELDELSLIIEKKKNKIVEHLDKEEKIKKTDEEAKLLFMSKPKLIKVVHEEASNVRIDHKVLTSAKGGQEFKKIQDAELKVLNREHSQKVTKAIELRKKRLDQYMWTTTNRLKPKPITDAKIYANTKPVIIIVYKGIDRLNFKVHNPFKFGDFRITELDELSLIIEKKKNKIVGVPFVNNMVIEEHEYEMFFIDVFGDEASQRMNDMRKVNIKTLLTYLVMASNITTPENQRFCLKLRELIGNHHDQEKLQSKRVNLEALGYKMD